jgi:hypothetical protein
LEEVQLINILGIHERSGGLFTGLQEALRNVAAGLSSCYQKNPDVQNRQLPG